MNPRIESRVSERVVFSESEKTVGLMRHLSVGLIRSKSSSRQHDGCRAVRTQLKYLAAQKCAGCPWITVPLSVVREWGAVIRVGTVLAKIIAAAVWLSRRALRAPPSQVAFRSRQFSFEAGDQRPLQEVFQLQVDGVRPPPYAAACNR